MKIIAIIGILLLSMSSYSQPKVSFAGKESKAYITHPKK